MKRLSIAEALREGIAEEMRRDPSVFCMGEDIAVPGGWGGAFTVTLGLEKEFPDRMLNTPIAELGFFGVAVRRGDDGHAADRRRPVRRLPLPGHGPDRQQRRQAALHVGRHDQGAAGDARADRRDRPRRRSTPRAWNATSPACPGIKVVAVSNAYDAKGILKAAVRDDNPVLIFEHKLLYGSKGARTEPGAVDATSDIPDGRLHRAARPGGRPPRRAAT